MRGKSTALFYVSFHPIKSIMNIDFYDFMKETRDKKPTLTIPSFKLPSYGIDVVRVCVRVFVALSLSFSLCN